MRHKSFLQKMTAPKQVTLADWLAMKPYDTPIANYDSFYLQQCQTVHSLLKKQDLWFKKYGITEPQFRELSCQLVSYFEDYIVEIGLWSSFIEFNKELYHYPLPFYDLTDYDETYINVEDIAFLIWHYLTKYSPEEYIINPDHDCIMIVSQSIFKHFENVMEQAPAINVYENIFTIKDDENYFVFKSKMKWFSTQSYLIGVDLDKKLQKTKEGLTKEALKGSTPLAAAHINKILYSMIEKYLYQKRCSFSALNGPEWFAKIAKCSDIRKQEIIDLTYWIDGKFLLKERQKTHFVFEHILTKTQYKATIDSFQNNKEMQPLENYAYNMHLIRWNGEYLLSGMMYTERMTPLSIKQYKAKTLETPWILSETSIENMKKTTNNMYETFLEFHGSPLTICENDAEAQKASLQFMEFYHSKIKKDDTNTLEEDLKKYHEKLGQSGEEAFKSFSLNPNFKTSVGIFFIKNVGIYTFARAKNVIHLLKKTTLTNQEKADLCVDFINGYNPDLCNYLIAQFGGDNIEFPTQDTDVDVIKHLPFFWRMNSPEEFERSYPLMTLVDSDVIE